MEISSRPLMAMNGREETSMIYKAFPDGTGKYLLVDACLGDKNK
jgi:hypothetical protein